MPTYHGSCHCGAVRFEIDTDLTEFSRCNCTLCRKKNAVMARVGEDCLRVTAGEDNLGLYRWNTRVARHHFCKTCGIYTFHRKRSEPDHYGVNVYCLDDAEIDGVPIIDADGRSLSAVE